jgi:hypothetical protein
VLFVDGETPGFSLEDPGLNLSICTFCTENPGSREPGYLKEGLSPLPWIYKFFTNSTSGSLEPGLSQDFPYKRYKWRGLTLDFWDRIEQDSQCS